MIGAVKLISLLATVDTAYGWALTFYAGDQCRGERLGRREVFISDGCQDGSEFNGIASSVIIQASTGDDMTQIVSFYDGNQCLLQNSVAAGNDGCISVGAGFNPFGSFNVIGQESGNPSKRTTRWAYNALQLREPQSFHHGELFEHDGKLWRWHEIAKDAFMGILADEWDNQRRVQSTEPLIFNASYPFNLEEFYRTHPEMAINSTKRAATTGISLRRQFPGGDGLESFCRIVKDCYYGIGMTANYYFPQSTEYVVNALEAARQQSTLERLWTFMVNPVVIGLGTGAETGYISARYFGSSAETAETCSASEDTAVLAALINQGLVGEDQVNAVRASIDNNDDQTSGAVAVAVVPPGVVNNGQFCAAPPTPSE